MLSIACEIQFTPLILSIFTGIGQLFVNFKRKELGIEVLGMV
jgi:hypothetical protein